MLAVIAVAICLSATIVQTREAFLAHAVPCAPTRKREPLQL